MMKSAEVRYNNQVKKLLADPQVLTRILKGTVEEFSDMSLKDIAAALGDSIEVSEEESFLTEHALVHMDAQESFIPGEGLIVYDIKCTAKLTDKTVDIIINVEAQKSSKTSELGYPLDKRIIYYLSRLISEQKNTYFYHKDYGKIRKVVSIWICMDTAADEDSINEIHLTQKSLFGEKLKLDNLDLMRAYVVSIRKNDDVEKSKNSLIAMLEDLLSAKDIEEKKNILHDEHQMVMFEFLEGGVSDMCNLSDLIKEDGLKEGIATERIATIVRMLKKNFSYETIKELDYTDEEIKRAEESMLINV
ncbi:MAG: PD-(D/E)XK nuclease family transposase [Pseudobutyrivibrio sp.]|nr:PD-(D/E)XK nuclease family transposase [Pseudobutyrivibrio sp.]